MCEFNCCIYSTIPEIHTFSSSLLTYCVICHYPSSFISAASLSWCVVERVISAKLHRRHRLSPRSKKQDGEIFTENRRGKGCKTLKENMLLAKREKRPVLVLVRLFSTFELSDNSCSVHLLLQEMGRMSQWSGCVCSGKVC